MEITPRGRTSTAYASTKLLIMEGEGEEKGEEEIHSKT